MTLSKASSVLLLLSALIALCSGLPFDNDWQDDVERRISAVRFPNPKNAEENDYTYQTYYYEQTVSADL